jgi:phenylacetate-CoA ligase
MSVETDSIRQNQHEPLSIRWSPDHRVRAGVLRALQHQLEGSQWLKQQEIELQQRRQLGVLLNHAAVFSRYYRRLLSKLNRDFVQDASFCLQDIPILSREKLQSEYAEICATDWPRHHGPAKETQTSGSTGQPVKVKRTGLCQMYWLALTLRDHLWHQRDFTATLAVIRVHLGNDNIGENVSPIWGEAVNSLYRSGPSHLLPITTNVNQQVEWLAKVNPGYLLTYPTNLAELMKFVEMGELHLPRLREIRTIGESVPDELREICSRLLGVKVTDMYSSQELGVIALQCPVSGLYHIQSENLLVEILNEQDQPCTPGEVGRVVVTDLHNFATPLIRYELRDYAEAGPKCPCGRGLPTIGRILGRRRNMVAYPNGQRHWPRVGYQHYREIVPGLKQYQLAQSSLQQIEVNLVVEGKVTQEQEVALTRVIQDALGYPFEMKFEYYAKELPRTRSGKFEEFICKVT